MLEHPEFPLSPSAKLGLAVVELLRGDSALLEFVGGRVDDYEVESLIRDGSLQAPSIAVLISATREQRVGANRRAEIETAIFVGLVSRIAGERTTSHGFLRERVVDYIKGLIEQESGVLRYEGECVSTGVLRLERPPDTRIADGTLILTPLRCVFKQPIRSNTREIIQ